MNEPHHFQSVHSRHEDIKNQEIELFSFEDREPLAAIAGKENNVARPFQQKPDRRLHGAFIIDDQDFRQSYLRPFEAGIEAGCTSFAHPCK